MKIGIDSRFALHNRRGIGNYTHKLILHLAEIDRQNEYILYTDKDDVKDVLPKQNNFKIKKLLPSNYFIWEQIVLSMQAQKDGVDILHCTGNTSPIYLNNKIKLVTTIHDVMYLKDYSVLPQSSSMYQKLGRLYRKIIVPKTIQRISKIITISNFSKDDIKYQFPALKEDIITVIPEGVDKRFHVVDKNYVTAEVRNKFDITGSYILILGGIDPRKNTEITIRQFIELKNELKIREKLVIVGIPDWKQTQFYNMVHESPCKKDIIFTDFITEDDLVLLYNCAIIFLYPSLYEGFGLPLLEAMACGVPVIASNITSIPEIVGDAALLINPHCGQEIKKALLHLLNNKNLRDDLTRRGFENVKRFSWQKMARDTLHIYEQVHETNKRDI